ncbi:MAG: type II toxin-antitoxin system RelE/ParE family toxin [Sphingomonadales bacterium]
MIDIRWSNRARNEFFGVGRIYAGRDPTFEERAQRRILAAVDLVIRYPRVGSIFRGVRRRRVGGAPFYIFFREVADHVEIVRILHIRSDWQSML